MSNLINLNTALKPSPFIPAPPLSSARALVQKRESSGATSTGAGQDTPPPLAQKSVVDDVVDGVRKVLDFVDWFGDATGWWLVAENPTDPGTGDDTRKTTTTKLKTAGVAGSCNLSNAQVMKRVRDLHAAQKQAG